MTTPPAEGARTSDPPAPLRDVSLPETHRTIPVPAGSGRFWRKLGAGAGPGDLVAGGYMDPGNWATDNAGGSAFG
jgi:manganese transport protein